jgi:protein-tyrosine phosphatase
LGGQFKTFLSAIPVQDQSLCYGFINIFLKDAQRLIFHRPRLMPVHYFCADFTMKILMVCLGNICRSPLAEGILQHKAKQAGLDWQIDSAGTEHYHIGEPPHPLSQKVAKLNGIDICNQRARRFAKEDFDRYDKLYAMSADVLDEMKAMSGAKFNPAKAELFLNEVYPGSNKSVPDPWYGTEPGYHEVYKIIEEACEAIIRKYAPNASGMEIRK